MRGCGERRAPAKTPSSERNGNARDHVANGGFGFLAGRHVAFGVGGQANTMRDQWNREIVDVVARERAARERFIPARVDAPSASAGVDRVAVISA